MTCKECNAPTTQTAEEVEVCISCGLLQEAYFPIISMEVERYVTARAEYHSAEDFISNLESSCGSYIAAAAYSSTNDSNQIFNRSTLLNQRNQQNSSKLSKILPLVESLKAICYKHFNDGVSNEAIKILKQNQNQWRNINKYHIFGACIYLASQMLSKPVSFADVAIAVNNSANCQITSFNEIGKVVKKITSKTTENSEAPLINIRSLPTISSTISQVKDETEKKENPPMPSIIEDKSFNNAPVIRNSHSIPHKTHATIEGIMNKHYLSLNVEYGTLQRAIELIPKYLNELEGRKPATIAAVCFLKLSHKLTIQAVGKVLRISRPTITQALKSCK